MAEFPTERVKEILGENLKSGYGGLGNFEGE